MRNIEWTARIAWGEARNQGPIGLQAVINVMANRSRDRRYPAALASVATEPWQFSAYNENDPNRPKLEAVSDNDPTFVMAVSLATQAVAGTLPDITGGATHYHSRFITAPVWTFAAIRSAAIGDHVFYRGVA